MIRKKVGRVVAPIFASALMVAASALMLATPAQAAFPATIKICNSLDTSDTNGGATDGKNIDVDRLSTSSYGTYSNELLPGDCTGNVNDPANVRIDLTDDGANFVPDGSAMIGVNGDGIDDSQGPYDMACVDSVTAANENALPPTETLASHANTTSGVEVRIRAARNCGAGLTDHVQVCNDAASADTNGAAADGKDFDVFKVDGADADTALDYNNELNPGECSNFKDTDGLNPLHVDLGDDGANTTLEYSFKQGANVEHCDEGSGADLADYPIEAGDDTPVIDKFRLYAPATTACGVTIPAPGTGSEAPNPDPTCASPQTADTYECDPDPEPAEGD